MDFRPHTGCLKFLSWLLFFFFLIFLPVFVFVVYFCASLKYFGMGKCFPDPYHYSKCK